MNDENPGASAGGGEGIDPVEHDQSLGRGKRARLDEAPLHVHVYKCGPRWVDLEVSHRATLLYS